MAADTADMTSVASRQRRPVSEVQGSLRPLGDPPPGVPVTLRLSDGVLFIEGDGLGTLGSWPVEELSAATSEEGAILEVEGEQFVLTCEDAGWERIVVRRLEGRPWWWMVPSVILGLLIALALFTLLG